MLVLVYCEAQRYSSWNSTLAMGQFASEAEDQSHGPNLLVSEWTSLPVLHSHTMKGQGSLV